MTRRPLHALITVAGLALAATGARAAPAKAAMFDVQFANLSPVAPDAAETGRLKRIGTEFRDLLQNKGLFTVVSAEPVREEVARSADLRPCNGCAVTVAKRLGADTAITGEVQKVSNLILDLDVYVKPVADDAPKQACSVDLRGNTDESFDRAVPHMVENNMSAGP
ncbi:DUF3280 domain-containing protein [Methylobacterium sp. J-092]|uniref:DUF3280 domain-containing protein n=1 Tax=Methylobacterium sp. J-092 TaxID=2836667 RepID=UPI001FBA5BE0|nr:DUF3280 domain-containing protein [Methylobacterium sp. J-092]MCJ2005658.1 DUF3280 domain-containing protein [Methylobacterium sp. J-092]